MTTNAQRLGQFVVFIFAAPVVIGWFFALIIWRAWWLYPAWAWFAVPAGAQPLTFKLFFGFLFLITSIRVSYTEKSNERINWPVTFRASIIMPILAWAVLWLVHYFAS